MSVERYLCDTCLYANNCQFIAKHKEGATGCSAYINTFGVSVDRIHEICAAERDGRLVVLPCKVGDAVYTVDLDCRDNPDQSKMCFCWNKSCKDCDKAYLRVWENHTKTADVRSIVSEMGLCGEKGGFGKTVFLTRAEAEAALKGDSRT
jgi:hypothetical protein